MTHKKTPSKPLPKPVIYVHAKGHQQISEDQAQALLDLGLPVCGRVATDGMRKTVHGYAQPALLLAELAGLFPGRPIVFLRAGLNPSAYLLDQLGQLLARSENPLIVSVLSNADTSMNPFAGVQAPLDVAQTDSTDLVSLLAPGHLHTLTAWTDHFAMLCTRAVAKLSGKSTGDTLMQQLANAGGRLAVTDHLFLHDPGKKLFEPLRLETHESSYPPPFAELSARLQTWFSAGVTHLPELPGAGISSTLHITHSWGGGVAQWLKSFIEADRGQSHYQLRSESPRSGFGFGQKLSLYAGNELRCPIASWWLQPAIGSIIDTDPGYRKILSEICRRYGIGRVFISSLVGHSLDTLRTGLPTLQVLHDHFPLWPLLSVDPKPYLQPAAAPDLKRALIEHATESEFPDKNASAWSQIRMAYVDAMREFDVSVAAPGQSVLDIQNKLEPAFKTMAPKVIPHGFPAMENLHAILPKPRKDGRRRMVILGRMQAGKGQQLLARALPELTKHVQVYLLGAGHGAEAFYGISGVNVVLNYQRDELASMLTAIGPDFAALLSVVPETFSFTLSELQHMRIPVIATRVGSFPDRIAHGKTGWLVEADPGTLVKQVAALCDSPDQIEAVRLNTPATQTYSLEDMCDYYNDLCPLPDNMLPFIPSDTDINQTQLAAAEYQYEMARNDLQNAFRKQARLNNEIEQRTAWALATGEELKLEQKRRVEWVNRLESEAEKLQLMVIEKQTDLQQKEEQLRSLESDYRQVSSQNELILSSSSWKVTRPFRAARRVGRNFKLARAWNPARWPWLISQLVRNISTLGIVGTLQRFQYTGASSAQEPRPAAQPEAMNEAQAPNAFPRPDQPKASIVIPVYNQWPYTAACLKSLLATAGKYSFEVIVVDDQSSDESASHLTQIKGITHLRNETNLGFVGSCNRGAGQARGEFLVLLNNDTQVTEGWLDELIETFEREPQAGLVGARLVYPDGRLQESGGMIFNDGSGWNYGRAKDAENPEYQFLRETDYCSGACVALKTAYFHEIGALDERYAPAYYEDTDLAFRVRESGLKVLVQPLSRVIHYEGITSGTDTSSGTKKYQLINQKKFVDRWQTELGSQPDKIPNPDDHSIIRRASQHHAKGRILFIDATTPEPDKDSGSVRLTNLMQCCRDMGYGVTFFADNRDYAGAYTRDLQRTGIEVLYHPWLDSLHHFFRDRGAEYDYIFISRHYIAINYISLLKRYCPDTQFIFDTVDLHYLREQRHAELENSLPLKRTAEQTRRSEMTVIKAADATLVVSTVEKSVLAQDAPGEKVHVLSNIHHVPGRDKDFADRKDIYFVGGYQHPPNIDAACWFVKDVWPLIREQLPQLCFHLIGSRAPAQVQALQGNGVIFHGFVDSLDPFLSDCRLAVAPLRYGAGVKGKVNMSMAHGQPVVATPAAVEGMFAEHERELLVAEDAQSFANEVIRLYQDEDLWNRLSDASVQNVEEHFSVTAARNSLTALFGSFAR